MSKNQIVIFGTIGAFLLFLIIIPYFNTLINKKIRRGKFREALISGDYLLLHSVFVLFSGGGGRISTKVSRSSRMLRIHAVTGVLEKQTVFRNDDWDWEMTVNGIAWFGRKENAFCKLMGMDLQTLQTIWTTETVLTKLGLPRDTKIMSFVFNEQAGIISIADNKAGQHVWDCNALKANSIIGILTVKKSTDYEKRKRNQDGAKGQFDFVNQNNEQRYSLRYKQKVMSALPFFLEPEWLSDWPADTSVLPNEAAVLFYQLETLGPDEPFRISLLGAETGIRWTFKQETLNIEQEPHKYTLPAIRIRYIGRVKDAFVFVADHARKDKVFALDTSTGALLWSRRM